MHHITRSHIVAALVLALAVLSGIYSPMLLVGAAAYAAIGYLARAILRLRFAPTSRAARRAQRRLLIGQED